MPDNRYGRTYPDEVLKAMKDSQWGRDSDG